MMFARLVVLVAAVAAAHVVGAPQAHADPGDGIALNGTYTAFSDGVWAKTNDSYHDERSVTQTWTITSTCTTYQDCTGRVTSDQGWSADMVYMSGQLESSPHRGQLGTVHRRHRDAGGADLHVLEGLPGPVAAQGLGHHEGSERRMRTEQAARCPAAVHADPVG